MHIMWKDVFKFEILTLHEPKKKTKWQPTNSKWLPQSLNRTNFTFKNTPKLQVEGCSFYWLDVFSNVCNNRY